MIVIMPEQYQRHPNTECSVCKKPIYKRPFEIAKGRVFCSKKCNGIATRITNPCPVCGIEVISSRNSSTCSRECSNKNRTGIKYYTGRKRDTAFNIRLRRDELILERGCKCEKCGFDNKEALELHHKIRKSDGGSDEKDNLIILCANCHLISHRTWKRSEEVVTQQF